MLMPLCVDPWALGVRSMWKVGHRGSEENLVTAPAPQTEKPTGGPWVKAWGVSMCPVEWVVRGLWVCMLLGLSGRTPSTADPWALLLRCSLSVAVATETA